ncbi:CLUMA_CG013186, isoform A [Clunio marinus]|uniref:CLUMA_CG013186, isoform A n=1 Tax=Clunio marinus TaxID=568069 RepID=A0A1J1II48_9DIPT|nr:CLUMA_CG013186, isoform A [Clunio marinus]
MDKRHSVDSKPAFNPLKVYKQFGNLTGASMRIIVHGFGSSCPHEWVDEMRSALMAVEDCFVVCTDWEKGAVLPNYVRAAANSRLVGKQLAFLLKQLNKHQGLEFSRVHLIGFSLGAHASGFAGAELKSLHRITGLDPAGPLFEGAHVAARLDESDAEFVDVIHSNGENLILGGLGSWQPMGHVDFYPNGGRVQTGCSNLFVGAVTDIIWTSPAQVEGRSLCNHRRAYKFFIHSVAPRCLFPAFPCNSYEDFLQGKCFSCPNRKAKSIRNNNTISKEVKFHDKVDSICGAMGYYADKSTGKGQLYLRTREEEPYCAHQYIMKIHSATNDLPIQTIGRIDVELESEGGLQEAFTITERDDQEMFAGDFISKIIVPHPALNFPKNVTVTYQVYRGWLTRGLSSWGINKVILSDSFGESHSLCKHFILESGKPQRMTLLPGDCHEEELILFAEKSSSQALISSESSTDSENLSIIYPAYSSNSDVMSLGKHIPLERNESETNLPSEDVSSLSWKPILVPTSSENSSLLNNTNSLSQNASEIDLNIGERMPKSEKAPTEKRSFGESTDNKINDFISIRDDSLDNEDEIDDEPSGDYSDDKKFVTVQLFQYRFGDVFEKAERYARLTLFPLLTEQISNIFNLDMNEKDSAVSSSEIATKSIKPSRKYDTVSDADFRSFTNYIKPIEKTNNNYESKREESVTSRTENVRISLPTYRPQDKQKKFIPIERAAQSEN